MEALGQQVLINMRKNVVTLEPSRCTRLPAGSQSTDVSERRAAVHLSSLTGKVLGLGGTTVLLICLCSCFHPQSRILSKPFNWIKLTANDHRHLFIFNKFIWAS